MLSIRLFTLFIVAINWIDCLKLRAGNDICEGQPNGSKFPNVDETGHILTCGNYLFCVNGASNLLTCPANQNFDPSPDVNHCRPDYDCRTTTSAPTTTTPVTTTTRPTTLPTTTPPPTTTTEASTTTSTTQPTTTTEMPTTTSTETTTSSTEATTTTSSTTTRPTTTQRPVTTPVATTSNPDDFLDPDVRCPSNDNVTNILHIPSNVNCSVYYMCYHGEPIMRTCADGLYWNIDSQKCDLPENVYCEIQVDSLVRCPREGVALLAHPFQENLFYFCDNGIFTIQQCDVFNYWDDDLKICVMRSF